MGKVAKSCCARGNHVYRVMHKKELHKTMLNLRDYYAVEVKKKAG